MSLQGRVLWSRPSYRFRYMHNLATQAGIIALHLIYVKAALILMHRHRLTFDKIRQNEYLIKYIRPRFNKLFQID